jgi:DNA gyrase subunit A
MRVSDIRVMGRATQGVRLIKLTKKDAISSIAKVDKDNEDEENASEVANNDVNTEDSVE